MSVAMWRVRLTGAYDNVTKNIVARMLCTMLQSRLLPVVRISRPTGLSRE